MEEWLEEEVRSLVRRGAIMEAQCVNRVLIELRRHTVAVGTVKIDTEFVGDWGEYNQNHATLDGKGFHDLLPDGQRVRIIKEEWC